MYKVEPHRSSPQLRVWADTDEVLILIAGGHPGFNFWQCLLSYSTGYVQYLDTACKSLARAIADKSKQELEDVVDAAILRLAAGQSEAVAKQWAKDQL